ncbi:transketolase C-terminal domain-containing protein [Zobellia nedashkovskayae]
MGRARELKKGSEVAILTIGHIGNTVSAVIEEIAEKEKIGHYDMRFIKPLDKKLLINIFKEYKHIITIENGSKIGGFGSAILELANELGYTQKIHILGIDDIFLEHGTVEQLHEQAKIDQLSITKQIKMLLNE